MWSDKTEPPTPRRREEARKEGIVARSYEVTSVAVMFVGVACITLAAPKWIDSLISALQSAFMGATEPMVWAMLLPIAILIILSAVAILAGALQTGFLITSRTLRPNFSRLNPALGVRRMLSLNSLWNGLYAILKVSIIGVVGYVTIRSFLDELAIAAGVTEAAATILSLLSVLVIRLLIVFVLLAVGDYAFQWWRTEMSLRMTRHELREELRHTEGEALVKARLRGRYRQLVMHRQVAKMKEASVLITNPTHIAVALKYDPKNMHAPQVIAKGAGWLAAMLISEARKHRVVVVHNPPLATALFKLPIGSFIPRELYQAVAEVLAYVFRVTGRIGEVLSEA